MFGERFIDLFNRYTGRTGPLDWADRLGQVTVALFLLTCTIVSGKQYVFNSISCYTPSRPSGDGFGAYLLDYCWTHGLIPLHRDERMPLNERQWAEYEKTRRLSYYQWVPFVLGLQCIFFYIPHIAWQALCANRSGGDLFALVKAAADAATTERGTREKQVKRVAEFLEDMIDGQRNCHKDNKRRRLTKRAFDFCGLCIVSKRLGTCLVYSYVLVKLITIINAIMQLYLIQRFLGFHSDGSAGYKSSQLGKHEENPLAAPAPENEDLSGFGFGLTVLQHIMSGRDWPETMIFPRVAYCRVPGIRLVGVENTYTAQCALPINMLNEKIYIFFWFWIVFLIFATVVSLGLWLFRMIFATRRKDFIKRFLRIKNIKAEGKRIIMRTDLTDFIDEYLRYDGVFLVRMLALNAGEVITSEIVVALYQDYIKYHTNDAASVSTENEKAPLAADGAKDQPPSYV